MRLLNNEVLLRWPLLTHYLTVGIYYFNSELNTYDKWHGAIDLSCRWNDTTSQPVYAAEDGIVDTVQWWDGHSKNGMQSYGNMVRITHAPYNGTSLQTRYAHLSNIVVLKGQHVNEGDIIGYTGNTGNSFGAHLHFEVILGGKRVNPLCWLDDDFEPAPGYKPYTFAPGEHSVVREGQKDFLEKGIDLSKHNWAGKNKPDFKLVRKAGNTFVILRAGYGKFSDQKDPYFEEGYKMAKDQGLALGAYWYSYATSVEEAKLEAKICLDSVGNKELPYGIWFDQEYEKEILELSTELRTSIVKAFCEEIKKAGYKTGLYCSENWAKDKVFLDKLEDLNLWIANYSRKPTLNRAVNIWQYKGGTGRCPGIDGPCDLNYLLNKGEFNMNFTFTKMEGKRLLSTNAKKKCETFSKPDIYDSNIVVIPLGDSVKVLEVSNETYTIPGTDFGGKWYKVQMQMGDRYCLGLEDRTQLIDEPVKPVDPVKPIEPVDPIVPEAGDFLVSGLNLADRYLVMGQVLKAGGEVKEVK